MIDLSTSWLGLSLVSPLIVGASPISKDTDAVAAAADAGAGAVIMYSLFEEQLAVEQMAAHRFLDIRTDSDAEARTFMPDVDVFSLDAEPYVRQLERLRKRVTLPVIASLNGTTAGGWTRYAKTLESAGASALELNLYEIATSADEEGAEVEQRQLDLVATIVRTVAIPVTVKLSPFYSALPAFARRLAGVGARGVAVFNRFYQPDVDLDALNVDRHLVLSTSSELPLRLHALAILGARSKLDLACTGGVHDGRDAAKAILCGAHVVQLASVLLQHGPAQVAVLRAELEAWLGEKGYRSSAEARGVLNLDGAPDPGAWERLNYTQMLAGWRSSGGVR